MVAVGHGRFETFRSRKEFGMRRITPPGACFIMLLALVLTAFGRLRGVELEAALTAALLLGRSLNS